MTKDDRTEKQLAAARANAEGLLKCAVVELRKLAEAPSGEGVSWFPNGIDGIKVSIKAFGVEASLELEGAMASSNGADTAADHE